MFSCLPQQVSGLKAGAISGGLGASLAQGGCSGGVAEVMAGESRAGRHASLTPRPYQPQRLATNNGGPLRTNCIGFKITGLENCDA